MKYIFDHKRNTKFEHISFTRNVQALLLCFFVFGLTIQSFSQCSLSSRPGNNVLSNPILCAPDVYQWHVWYTIYGSPANVEFEFFWGDEATPGASQIVSPTYVGIVDGGNQYEITIPHAYDRDAGECNYTPTVYLRIDGQRCASTVQTQNVTVWDVDDRNGGELIINPDTYRICVGEGASINFTDNTIFNCVPASGENDHINNPVRWIQWVYGTGAAADRLSGVEVNGTSHTYEFEGNVKALPGPVINSGETSELITVAPTTAADLGKQFEVTLRNWNYCSPYDADTTDGYLNPINVGGDNPFISSTARIVVVEKSNPSFQTRLNDISGPVQSDFCINDQIFFENLTHGIDDDHDGNDDSDFEWVWEFYDDNTQTTLLDTQNGESPTFSYSTSGSKSIKLIARDLNTVGQCGGVIILDIDILSTPTAAINVTDTNDNPLANLCLDSSNPQNIDVRFHDVSSDFDVNSSWEWNIYDAANTLIDNQSGSGSQGYIDQTFSTPGTYLAELISSTIGVDCETRDTAYIHIYDIPSVDFIADEVCLSDSSSFESLASLNTVVNEDQINLYEWDFDYDGSSFDVDATFSSAAPFKYKYNSSGTFTVAHRVSTLKGECSSIVTKSVTVKPVPDVNFSASVTEGCSPLEVDFSLNTLLADQPTSVNSYIWYVKDLRTNVVSNTIVNPAEDQFTNTFLNTQTSFIDHNYEVWLEANSANGCNVVSDTINIKVFAGPPSSFSITNLSGIDANCAPRTYHFKVDATTRNQNPDQYHWEIIDLTDSSIVYQTTEAGTEPNFSYTLTNTSPIRKNYSVALIAEKSGLCFSRTERVVEVNPVPNADFTYEILEADCETVTYKIEAAELGLFYQWNVSPTPLNSPDLSENSIELQYQKSSSSAYNVNISLQTENIVGCISPTNTQTISIDTQEKIGASFDVSPTILEIPDKTISITNHTLPGDWTYFWDFGDGTTSTEKDPSSHTYDTFGEYKVKLRAEGLYCFEEDSATVIIRQAIPEVDFSFTSIEGCLPLEVTFTNQTLYADSSTFLWDMGDGTLYNEVHPVHTYTESGIYQISLQASNELGIVSSKQIELVVDLDQGPESNFRIRLAAAYLPGQEISFINQSQRAENYFWDFGDGTTSTEANPVHVYQEVGHYQISLLTSNSLGCTDTLSQEIFIEPFHPEVDFTYEPPTGCRPLTVQFRNLSRFAESGTYRWSFGEGEGVSTEENPSYTYYEPGMYTVTLEATNSNGVTEQAIKEFSVEVYETPRAAFNLRPQEAFLTEPIYFVNLSVDAVNYFWDFGDGTTSTEFEPSHIYENTGIYDVTLIAESEKGCTDTLRMVSAVIINNGGKVNVPNAFTPNTNGPGGSDASSASNNDVFLPVFEGLTGFHMMIYNRWGELLFESVDKAYGWDGYYKGRLCTRDVYVYKLELEFSDGNSRTVVGDVTLLR